MPQPAPVGKGKAILPLVLADLKARAVMGKKKYGTLLRAHNGRDALMDLAQELLDGMMYLYQYREEMKCLGNDLRRLSALLAAVRSPVQVEFAEAVFLLESILRKNPVLVAE